MKLHRILRERWCFDARRAVTRTAGWRWRSFGRRREFGIMRDSASSATVFGSFAMRAASLHGSAPERAIAETTVSGIPFRSSQTMA